jgi:hypothetical protein
MDVILPSYNICRLVQCCRFCIRRTMGDLGPITLKKREVISNWRKIE